jgi:tetratricopeptide (TPR) repeat protein
VGCAVALACASTPPAEPAAAPAPEASTPEQIVEAAAQAAWSGDRAGAESILRDALQRARDAGASEADVLFFTEALSTFYSDIGRPEAIGPHLEDALSYHEKRFGPHSYGVGSLSLQLGRYDRALGRIDESAQASQRAVEVFETDPPPPEPHHPSARALLREALWDAALAAESRRDYDEAARLHARAVKLAEAEGVPPPLLARHRNQLASVYARQERCDQAIPLFAESLPVSLEQQRQPDTILPRLLWVGGYVRCLLAGGDRGTAAAELHTLTQTVEDAASLIHYARSAPLIFELERDFESMGEYGVVASIATAQLQAYGGLQRAPYGAVVVATATLATSLGKQGHAEEAEATFERALDLARQGGEERRGADLEAVCLGRYEAFLREQGRSADADAAHARLESLKGR